MTSQQAEPEPFVPKLNEARQLVDAARWALLDVVLILDESEAIVMRDSRARLNQAMESLDLTGLQVNEAAGRAEEYEPDAAPDNGDTPDCL